MKKLIKNNRGFSLVELIVVIAIMVILIAMLVPQVIGYMEASKRVALKADAKQIYVATQAALIDSMVQHPTVLNESFNFTMPDGYGGTKAVGRVTNFAFAYSQSNNGINDPGQMTSADKIIARNVLERLGWEDTTSARYPFKVKRNPVGRNVNEYQKETGQPGFMVAYNTDGTLEFIEWGEGGYLVHVDNSGQSISIVKNGSFSNYSGW